MNSDIFNLEQKPKGYYVGLRNEMLRFIPRNIGKVLEVGCGEGEFGRLLKSNLKAEVWGIEISETAAKNAQKELDKVLIGNIEEENIPLPKGYFDCIIFNDVLEHLRYPWNVLKNIKKNLKPNGYVVASIPNIRYYYTVYDLLRYGRWRYEDKGILDKTHLRFFTIESIKEMFKASGYYLSRIEGINACKVSWKFRIFNWFMMKRFEDMRYTQFACVAQPVKGDELV